MYSAADWTSPDAGNMHASSSCDLMARWVRKKKCDESLDAARG